MKQTITIRMAKEQIETLREIAKAEDRSLSAVIRRCVDAEIEQRGGAKRVFQVQGKKTEK